MQRHLTAVRMHSPLLTLLAVLALFSSCEKDITVNLPHTAPQLVVEGYVYSGEAPYVFVTRSADYFDPLDSAALIAHLVFDAVVLVSDGITTDTLSGTLDTDFSIPWVYKSSRLTGTPGRNYTLTVMVDSDTLTSVTQVPYLVPLDSVWFKVDGNRDSLGYAWAHLTDPDTLGNGYRWFAKRIGKDDDFIAPLGSVFEDKFINGKSFDFGYNRGTPPNSTAEEDLNEERGYFKKGDTIAVKFCTIDRRHFLFWRSVETQLSNNGNPFSSPGTIESNILGGLGIWGGYGVSYDTIVAR
jgi:hypothetical protein